MAVSHNQFKNYKVDDFIKISKGKLVLLDIKGMYNFSIGNFKINNMNDELSLRQLLKN